MTVVERILLQKTMFSWALFKHFIAVSPGHNRFTRPVIICIGRALVTHTQHTKAVTSVFKETSHSFTFNKHSGFCLPGRWQTFDDKMLNANHLVLSEWEALILMTASSMHQYQSSCIIDFYIYVNIFLYNGASALNCRFSNLHHTHLSIQQ